jgi:hypothetical protein
MILVREKSGLRFREDILRGVRLFAIVFAAVLVCVAGYRMLRAPSDVQGAPPDAIPEAVQSAPEPSPDAAPASETASETHPLVVPEPPPVEGKPVATRVVRPKDQEVPPPPPIGANPVRARRAAVPSGREFESSDAVALPAAPAEDPVEAKPSAPNQTVGYKSLIEADPNKPPAQPTVSAPAAAETGDPAAKGNRFFKAVGKIFHPSGKKDTEPSTLQPKQP